MKAKPQILIIYFLMGVLTLGYTMLIRLGLSTFNILYEPGDMAELPLLSQYTAQLSVIESWQILAWCSFLISLVWGLWRNNKGQSTEPFLVPWVCHLTWIVASFFLNAVGALAPFVAVAYVIP